MNAKLTAKETALMTAIADGFFSFFDQGLVHGSGIWTNTMTEEVAGSTRYDVSGTRRGVATVIASLGRKGLLITEDQGDEDGAWTDLSPAGEAWVTAFNTVDNDTTAAVLVAARTEEAPAAAAPAAFAKGDIVLDKDGERFTVRRINANGSIRLIDELGTKVNRKAENLTKVS